MKEKEHPTYIMVRRKLVVAILTVVAVLFIGVLESFQYANYVDRKSNHVWCTLIGLFNEAYAENPPPSPLGKQIANEMSKLPKQFSC